MRYSRLVVGVLAVAAAVGCTRVVVNKDPGPHDKGFRYWRPKPYLFIGPAGGGGGGGDDGGGAAEAAAARGSGTPLAASTDRAAAGGATATATSNVTIAVPAKTDGGVTPAAPASIQVTMELKYLPDYNEEYSIRLRPGIGSGNLNFALKDGWNLTSVGMETDQQVDELLTSFSALLGSVGGLIPRPAAAAEATAPRTANVTPAAAGHLMVIDSRPDVPLGFYEPVIATDPSGKKSLFGWRYVGFAPFAGCPIQPAVCETVVSCDPSELYGLVATATGGLKFDRLSNIRDGVWPYKYKHLPPPAVNGDAPPTPGKVEAAR